MYQYALKSQTLQDRTNEFIVKFRLCPPKEIHVLEHLMFRSAALTPPHDISTSSSDCTIVPAEKARRRDRKELAKAKKLLKQARIPHWLFLFGSLFDTEWA